MEQVDSSLRYVAAEHIGTPTGPLAGAVVVSPNDETIGTLDGMVIDPIERHVRYFVVRSRKWLTSHLHLAPATPARLDSERKALHVDISAEDLRHFREVRPDTFQRYSPDDLIAGMFPAHAA